MSGGFQFLDILVFAMVAAFLLLRLHRVLGRRTGHERPPPEPVADNDDSGSDTVVNLPDARRKSERQGRGDTDLSSASGLTQLKITDPSFSEDGFLEGARGAFEMILNAFAAGDKRQLRGLLDNDVYGQFVAEIDRRNEAGERLETTLVSIILADLVDASVAGRRASVTVKFMSEQVNVTRNADGDVIDGDPSQVATINDIWTFTRDIRSRDPNWQLAETRSED